MAHVRRWSVVESALRASDSGVPDAENAARHEVAVKTIRRWRRDYQRRGRARGQGHTCVACPVCDEASLDHAAYAELLGWYLGDGYISLGRRGVFNLHVYNDLSYVACNAHIQDLMRRVKPGGRPHVRSVPGCLVITVSWKHWPCLFPQHGSGRKHEREIVLTEWQEGIVTRHPADFLRGLFHSDGSRVANWTSRTVDGHTRRYDYPRWQFVNASDDIRELCCWALDLADVAWTRSNRRTVSVSRRSDVARLDTLIGLKH